MYTGPVKKTVRPFSGLVFATMSDTDDHSSPTHAYASVDDSGLASQNVLSPSQVRRRVVQSSESFDEHQLEQVNCFDDRMLSALT